MPRLLCLRRLALLSVLLVATAATAAPVESQAFRYGVPEVRVPGQAIVKLEGIDAVRVLRPRVADKAAQAVLDEVAGRTGARLTLVRPVGLGWGLYEVRDLLSEDKARVPDEAETAALIERLARDPAVRGAQANRWLRPLRVPSDDYYPAMWHLSAIGAEAAWDLTTGTSGQRVGVIDTGVIRAHLELSGKDVAGYDFISFADVGNDGDGRDANYNDPGDGDGQSPSSFHGTHVSGTILATANNGGVPGLNWGAGLVTVRALGVGGGTTADIMEGALWLSGYDVPGVPPVGANKVSVMNLSLGGFGQCAAYDQEVVDAVNAAGVLFVAAAGNDGGAVNSPANCSGVITVAAFGPGGSLTSYSSFGPQVEVVAPGGEMVDAVEEGILSSIGPGTDTFTWQQGTSMASPHVAGALSLAQSLNPQLTFQEVRDLLATTGSTCGGCQGVPGLQLDALLAAIGGTPVEPPPPPPPAADDAYEENDFFEDAAAIACGQTVTGFAAPVDADYFRLTPEAGKLLSLRLHADNGGDLDLYVFTAPSLDALIGASENFAPADEAIDVEAPGGELTVLVNPWFDEMNNVQHSDDYTLEVICADMSAEPPPTEPPPAEPPPTEPPPSESPPTQPPSEPMPNVDDDAFEPNDLAASAAPLACGESASDLVALTEDWFAVEVEDGLSLRVATTGQGDPFEVAILDEEEQVLERSDGASPNATVVAPYLAQGAYLVRVRPAMGGGASRYGLRVTCLEDTPTVDVSCNHASTPRSPLGWASLALLGLGLVWRRRRVAARA